MNPTNATIGDNLAVGEAEVLRVLKEYELESSVDEHERIVLAVAAGERSREDLSARIERHVVEMTADRKT